jgi:hypothetical protein
MVLSLPKGHYKLHDRQYGTNLIDKMWEMYGWMPSMLVSESMMLGLQALYPEKVYASFTLGLDAIEIKDTETVAVVDSGSPEELSTLYGYSIEQLQRMATERGLTPAGSKRQIANQLFNFTRGMR